MEIKCGKNLSGSEFFNRYFTETAFVAQIFEH